MKPVGSRETNRESIQIESSPDRSITDHLTSTLVIFHSTTESRVGWSMLGPALSCTTTIRGRGRILKVVRDSSA
jgi:hypothetical protein